MRHLRHKRVARSATTDCRGEFVKGQAARRKHPLGAGVYKLEEVQHRLGRCRDTLEAIAVDRRKGAKGHGRYFGNCTSDDASVWLKCLPGIIAFDLGYYTLPAIAALGSDGAASQDVGEAVTQAQAAADALVDDCERARQLLKAGIAPEYKALRDGYSELPLLLDRAGAIIAAALSIVP